MKHIKSLNLNDFLEPEIFECLSKSYVETVEKIEIENAIFSVYHLKINLFTYFLGSFYKKIKVIGIPLSVCEKGYKVFNQEGYRNLAEWIQKQKGFTIILNANNDFDIWFTRLETLPTMVLKVNSDNLLQYKKCLRSHYRYRLSSAEKHFSGVFCKESVSMQISENLETVYALYKNVYERSDFKLDQCTKEYFRDFNAECTIFYANEIPIGFCQYKVMGNILYFLFCGMDYKYLKAYDTYYNILLYLVKKGIELKVEYINFGQTTEITKARFGAFIEKRYLYAYHSNFIIRKLIKFLGPLFSYKSPPVDFTVFKDAP